MTDEVRDKPAERGITINNILLSIVILGGGIFSTLVINSMSSIQDSVDKVEDSVSTMQVTNGITSNELKHIHSSLKDCRKFHDSLNARLNLLEKKETFKLIN